MQARDANLNNLLKYIYSKKKIFLVITLLALLSSVTASQFTKQKYVGRASVISASQDKYSNIMNSSNWNLLFSLLFNSKNTDTSRLLLILKSDDIALDVARGTGFSPTDVAFSDPDGEAFSAVELEGLGKIKKMVEINKTADNSIVIEAKCPNAQICKKIIGQYLVALNKKLAMSESTTIGFYKVFLENEVKVIEDITFIGCTLWTLIKENLNDI